MSDDYPRGWDNPGGTYHWYEGGSPDCGSDAPLSGWANRRKILPPKHKRNGRVCRRCLQKHSDKQFILIQGGKDAA